jgi:hypothetical protein
MPSGLPELVDRDEFVDRGFVRLRNAVPDDVVRAVRAAAQRLVPDEADAPWKIGMASVYDLPVLAHAVSPLVRRAVDALVGRGRWHFAAMWGFPTRFPGPIDPLWHIDGDWFTHHLVSGDQVLTPIFFWDHVGPQDGPTLLCPGSHLEVARLIESREPEGIPGSEIALAVHSRVACERPVPAIGSSGDVMLCHPFLAHTINPAGSTRGRYISNVAVHGVALRLDENDHRSSPVERAIARALATERDR